MSDREPITFTATIMNGTITITTKTPEVFEMTRETIMSIMIELAGDNPIAYSDCLEPEDTDAIARRLAKLILGEAA